MTSKLILGMCSYMDGKHESLIQFQSEFPPFVNQKARDRDLNLEFRLLRLVGCDEMSRKKQLHSNVSMFNIVDMVEYDAIFDRLGTFVPTVGIFLDRAVYSGTQVFNRPISIDESKARDYMIANMAGFAIPRTVILPQGCYVRAHMVSGSDTAIEFDVNFDEAVRYVGGYPCFLKRASGGGRVHVYKVQNKAELVELYQLTRELLMVLQEAVDIECYIRTFCFGEHVIHANYDIEKPDGQKYTWPQLSDQDRLYLDKAIPALGKELLTSFCTMEIAKSRRDGKWYFIDITNGCNFDMREGELSTPIYNMVKQALMEELIAWTLNPRPMIAHSHMQQYVLRKQLCRAYLKGQNPEFLLKFGYDMGYNIDAGEFTEERKKFEEEYGRLYGN